MAAASGATSAAVREGSSMWGAAGAHGVRSCKHADGEADDSVDDGADEPWLAEGAAAFAHRRMKPHPEPGRVSTTPWACSLTAPGKTSVQAR